MPSSALTTYKNALSSQIILHVDSSTVWNRVIWAKCQHLKERIVNAMVALEEIESGSKGGVVSYSISGRTFTRRNLSDLREHIADMESELNLMMWGEASRIDASNETYDSS